MEASDDPLYYKTETREMGCCRCFFVYSGWWPGEEPEGKPVRKPCPMCGEPEPIAFDTIGSVYHERTMIELYGPEFFERHYWWKPEYVHPAYHEGYRAKSWREAA